MVKDNFVYLNHILTCIHFIEKYTNNKSYKDLVENSMMQDALVRQIEVIGEATVRIEKSFKDRYNKIPWIDMKGMRNKLIHDYFGINIKHVWNVVKQDIPNLKIEVTKILIDNDIQIKIGF